MKTLVEQGDQISVLNHWSGADAKIWIFDTTLKKLGIKITRQGEPLVIYIVGVGCQRISGPFSWTNSKFSIVTGLQDANGESVCSVVDERVGFELTCSNVVVVQGSTIDFDKTFDNFLGDSK